MANQYSSIVVVKSIAGMVTWWIHNPILREAKSPFSDIFSMKDFVDECKTFEHEGYQMNYRKSFNTTAGSIFITSFSGYWFT